MFKYLIVAVSWYFDGRRRFPFFTRIFFSSSWVSQQSHCRGSSIRRPWDSFSETMNQNKDNFHGKALPIMFPDIFSSAWLCQQSSWNRNLSVVCRPSSVRPSVRVAIISEPNARISFKFWLLLPLDHALGLILNFWFFFWFFFTNIVFISLTWDPMGAKISKRNSSYKSQPKAFRLFLNFLPNGPHETTFVIFEILKI